MGGAGAPNDLDKGHRTQVWLATGDEPAAMVSGRYFFHRKLRDPDPATKDVERQGLLPRPVSQSFRDGFPNRKLHRSPQGTRVASRNGKLKMPVLAFGGEATFGPMIGTVIRCVADNVEDAIIPDCGHWITEEQPTATTKLVVDFLHRRS